MDTFFSIIIPCYNSSKTIKDTLNSVFGCNDSNLFETIIVNDGSTDNTIEVINDFLEETNYEIRIINQKNSGVSIARNNGILASKGKYILFLDSDDLLAPNFINKMYEILNDKNYDTAFSFRTNEISMLNDFNDSKIVFNDYPVLSILKDYTYNKKTIGFTCFFYKKQIIDEKKLLFTAGSKYGEDVEFVTKYLAHCSTCLKINAVSYFYRIVANSVTRTISFSQTDVIFSAIRSEEYLKSINHPFYLEFSNYMVPRAIFSCAHRFANAKNKELFNKLIKDFDAKKAIKKLFKNKNTDFKTKIACAIFIFSKSLFFLLSF